MRQQRRTNSRTVGLIVWLLLVALPILWPGRACLSDTSLFPYRGRVFSQYPCNQLEVGRQPVSALLPAGYVSAQSPEQGTPADVSDLPPWVVVYPNATFAARSSTSELPESGYMTLVTNDAASTIFDFYKQAYEEKINDSQFTVEFLALAPHYGELWLAGADNETVRVAVVSAAALASQNSALQASAKKTFIHVSYARSANLESAHRHPMSEIGELADLDFQPTHFECELEGDERFLFTREYLKAIHFVHRQHLTSRFLEFGPLVEAGPVRMPASEDTLAQLTKTPPWVVIYPGARLLARVANVKKASGLLMLLTDHSQEQVYAFYNRRLKELYLSFGLEQSSWSKDVEFSTAEWTNGSDKVLSVITLQDKSPQTVILLRYKGEAARAVKPHRRHPPTRRF